MSYSYTLNVYQKNMHKPSETTNLDLSFFCDDAQQAKLEEKVKNLREIGSFTVVELVDDQKKSQRLNFTDRDSEDTYLENVAEIVRFKERAHLNAFFGPNGVCPAH